MTGFHKRSRSVASLLDRGAIAKANAFEDGAEVNLPVECFEVLESSFEIIEVYVLRMLR